MTGVGPIQSGFPPVPTRGRRKSFISARLLLMKVGEFFIVDSPQLRECARAAARYHGIKVETHKVEDGWGIWRVA